MLSGLFWARMLSVLGLLGVEGKCYLDGMLLSQCCGGRVDR